MIGIQLDTLLDNAIKYGRDDGPGVAPDGLAYPTNQFFRVTGTQATKGSACRSSRG